MPSAPPTPAPPTPSEHTSAATPPHLTRSVSRCSLLHPPRRCRASVRYPTQQRRYPTPSDQERLQVLSAPPTPAPPTPSEHTSAATPPHLTRSVSRCSLLHPPRRCMVSVRYPTQQRRYPTPSDQERLQVLSAPPTSQV